MVERVAKSRQTAKLLASAVIAFLIFLAGAGCAAAARFFRARRRRYENPLRLG